MELFAFEVEGVFAKLVNGRRILIRTFRYDAHRYSECADIILSNREVSSPSALGAVLPGSCLPQRVSEMNFHPTADVSWPIHQREIMRGDLLTRR